MVGQGGSAPTCSGVGHGRGRPSDSTPLGADGNRAPAAAGRGRGTPGTAAGTPGAGRGRGNGLPLVDLGGSSGPATPASTGASNTAAPAAAAVKKRFKNLGCDHVTEQLPEAAASGVQRRRGHLLPAGVTFDAFVNAIASCYGADAALSPANLASAWATAGWLGMSAEDYYGLARTSEDYFFQEVATDHARASEVLRSCSAFLGGEAAGPATELLVRCMEALAASSLGVGGEWLDDVAALPVEEFLVTVEAMRARFIDDHDLLYTVVDRYLERHKGKLTEEEKSRLCYNVNCTMLSQHVFMHLVQNPRLPLRFVVQAMLVEQLHSHQSMLLNHHHRNAGEPPAPPPALLKGSLSGGGVADATGMTLGDILQRDSVLRQSAHIRASMQATRARIESLERELTGLRTRLRRSEQHAADADGAKIGRATAKSASFRIPRNRLWNGEDISAAAVHGRTTLNTNASRGFKSRLVHGFKNLFSRRPAETGAPSACGDDDEAASTRDVREKGAAVADARELKMDTDGGEVSCMAERWRPHRRNHSVV